MPEKDPFLHVSEQKLSRQELVDLLEIGKQELDSFEGIDHKPSFGEVRLSTGVQQPPQLMQPGVVYDLFTGRPRN